MTKWDKKKISELRKDIKNLMLTENLKITQAISKYAVKIDSSYNSVAGRWYARKRKRVSVKKVTSEVVSVKESTPILKDNKLVLDIKTISVQNNKLIITF